MREPYDSNSLSPLLVPELVPTEDRGNEFVFWVNFILSAVEEVLAVDFLVEGGVG